MWINDGLNVANKYLANLERDKQNKELERLRKLKKNGDPKVAELTNPDGWLKLHNSNIWAVTKKEYKSLIAFAEKIKTYNSRHPVQEDVISFSFDFTRGYKVLPGNHKNVDKYIDRSMYWEKKTVGVKAGNNNKTSLNVIYAVNNEMDSVIFEYLTKMIVTTKSSFENYLRVIEGKPLKYIKFYHPGMENNHIQPVDVAQPVPEEAIKEVLNLLAKFNGE